MTQPFLWFHQSFLIFWQPFLWFSHVALWRLSQFLWFLSHFCDFVIPHYSDSAIFIILLVIFDFVRHYQDFIPFLGFAQSFLSSSTSSRCLAIFYFVQSFSFWCSIEQIEFAAQIYKKATQIIFDFQSKPLNKHFSRVGNVVLQYTCVLQS
jgi:hypothetical protein